MAKQGIQMQGGREWSPLVAFGGKRRKSFPSAQDLVGMALLLLILLWIMKKASALPQYEWQWPLLGEFLLYRNPKGELEAGLLLQGLFTTLRVGVWSFLLALFVGSLLGFCFAGRRGLHALPYRFFVNIIRNTPPLVLLFCVYFFAGNFLPMAQLEEVYRNLPIPAQEIATAIYAPRGQLDRMTAAVLALGIYQSAYMAEIIRAGIESVDRGQWDASLALGFSRAQSLRHVILPQSFRLILPPMTGQAISSFKDSALASLISLPDLTFQSLEIMAVSRMTFEVWVTCGILYLLLGTLCALAGRYLEKTFTF